MKTKKLKKKLNLKRITISNLSPNDEKKILGGFAHTEWCSRFPCSIILCPDPEDEN